MYQRKILNAIMALSHFVDRKRFKNELVQYNNGAQKPQRWVGFKNASSEQRLTSSKRH